jgi:hypothetical protein
LDPLLSSLPLLPPPPTLSCPPPPPRLWPRHAACRHMSRGRSAPPLPRRSVSEPSPPAPSPTPQWRPRPTHMTAWSSRATTVTTMTPRRSEWRPPSPLPATLPDLCVDGGARLRGRSLRRTVLWSPCGGAEERDAADDHLPSRGGGVGAPRADLVRRRGGAEHHDLFCGLCSRQGVLQWRRRCSSKESETTDRWAQFLQGQRSPSMCCDVLGCVGEKKSNLNQGYLIFCHTYRGRSFKRDFCLSSYNFATLRLDTQQFRHFVRRDNPPPPSTLDRAREMTSLPSPLSFKKALSTSASRVVVRQGAGSGAHVPAANVLGGDTQGARGPGELGLCPRSSGSRRTWGGAGQRARYVNGGGGVRRR